MKLAAGNSIGMTIPGGRAQGRTTTRRRSGGVLRWSMERPRALAPGLAATVALGLAATVALAVAPVALASAATGEHAVARADVEVLSRPGQLSRWAYVVRPVAARSHPRRASDVVATLGTTTPDGTDELVLLLQQTLDDAGATWVRVRLPVRPNNKTGWVPARALSEFHGVRTHVKISRARQRLVLVRSGRVVFSARVGIGRRKWPTPRGEFYVRNRLEDPGGLYGPLAFGTSAHSNVLTDWPGGGVVGIHGTDQPQLLPGRVSHGCIRLRNRDILRLGRLMPVGTPVSIFD